MASQIIAQSPNESLTSIGQIELNDDIVTIKSASPDPEVTGTYVQVTNGYTEEYAEDGAGANSTLRTSYSGIFGTVTDGSNTAGIYVYPSGAKVYDGTTERKIAAVDVADNYANDAAAAAAGIPVGGFYHSSGTVKIRLV